MAKKIKRAKYGHGSFAKTKKALPARGASRQKDIFQQALALHQAGRLPEAETLYRQILLREPNHPEALNFLGLLAYQCGNNETAVVLIGQALASKPDYVDAHCNLGVIFSDIGRLDEAVASFRRALSLRTDYAEVHNNLGMALKDQGKLDEAVACFRQALALKSAFPEVYYNLGNVLNDLGQLDEAVASYREALALRPDFADAHLNLGNALKDQGRLEEAAATYRQALALRPDFADAHYNLGNVLKDQGRLEEAVASFRRSLAIRPDYAGAHNNLGNVLKTQGRLEEAVSCFRQAITLQPDDAFAYNNLASVLIDQAKYEEAVGALDQALALMPDFADARYNLGNALKDQGRLVEAAVSYRQAIVLQPDHAKAHNNLGNVLKAQGKLEEAIASYRRACAINPDFFMAHSNLLLCMNYLPHNPVSDYLNEARHYGRKAADKVRSRFSDWTCPDRPERLRVGMVSGDFRNHPVGYFLENMLTNLDHARIDLIAYSTNNLKDELTARIHSGFSDWKPLADLDDEAAARLIHDDGVHILLDLAGHTRHNRLPVFAWRPAPVQASWLGYFASTGIEEMDYILADPISVRDSQQGQFTERVWYLPDTRLCFSPPVLDEKMKVTPLPAISNGYITFGCFQEFAKINEDVLSVWGRIFQALPRARLRLQNQLSLFPAVRDELLGRLMRHGIARERVTFEKPVPRIEYLAAHADIDIILDTFPFTGGTTTCEALWMGVPTVTLAGDTMIARQGASLLASAGLTDWIATNSEDYVAKTVVHAKDLDSLARLRAGLRQQVLSSPLFDGLRFARNFEMAMWAMWHRFLAEQRGDS